MYLDDVLYVVCASFVSRPVRHVLFGVSMVTIVLGSAIGLLGVLLPPLLLRIARSRELVGRNVMSFGLPVPSLAAPEFI